ncbi:MAG: PilT/PilU family type 4a pilus ATPase [Rickettsiales bacterium]|nr:PilT/PilU family type 4a pilus ATPase [Rickettsiales bacterium]
MSEKKINYYLQEMVSIEASDLYITTDLPATYRVQSNLVRSKDESFTTSDIEKLVKEFLTDEQMQDFLSTLELNVAYSIGEERFRINVFYQQKNIGLVVRHIKSKIPTFKDLGLPESYRDFIMAKRGLFLIAGATGSGKSTSVAACLEHRNNKGSGHIVTIEDPIEYVFKHKNCIFTQREIGIDTYSYGIALKNAFRQAPDVIFIGEIRDRDSIENAIMFSETGHLVVATIHASNTNQTFERILSLYPEEVHNQILISLSHNLVALCGQRLVKNLTGNLVLSYEILKNEGLVTELIREGKFHEIKEVINKNLNNGMMSFDESLFRLYRDKIITRETALKEADNPNNLRLRLSQFSESNLSTSLKGITQTTVDEDTLYGKNKKSDF